MNVLFVCTQNAGRSQIAEALFDRTRNGAHAARSAGTAHADSVHPEVVEVMRELGIDLAEDSEWADVVVTMGCGDACPVLPGKRYVDWTLDDPSGRPIEEVRRTRDEIERRVTALIADLDG